MEQTLNEILSDPSFKEGIAWRRLRFCNNEILVKEGDNGTTMFYIEKGSLRVTGRVELGQNRRVHPGFCDLHAGDIFGEICLNEIHRRTATVTAISEVCVLEINGEKLNTYLDEHPQQAHQFYRQLFIMLIDRVKSANHRIENLLAWGIKAYGIEQHLLSHKVDE